MFRAATAARRRLAPRFRFAAARTMSTKSAGGGFGRALAKVVGVSVLGGGAVLGGAYAVGKATAPQVPVLTGRERIEDVDALVIGAGIMGASVALMYVNGRFCEGHPLPIPPPSFAPPGGRTALLLP